MSAEGERRLRARNLQLLAALSAARDLAEDGDLGSVKRVCDEQAAMGWADADDPAEPYRELVRAMLANDEPCTAPGCVVSLLGHLLPHGRPELVALVRELDETDGLVTW